LNRSAGATAAVEVSVMKASARAYGIELAESNCEGMPRWRTSSPIGLCAVDQMASGSRGGGEPMLPLVCQDCTPQPLIRLSDRLRLWGVSASQSGGGRNGAGTARAAVFMAYKLVCELEGGLARFDESGPFPRWTDRVEWLSLHHDPSLFRSKL